MTTTTLDLSGFVAYDSPETEAKALSLAKGSYQRNLLRGVEAWSGSTLKGKAREHGASYYRSRLALTARLQEAGLQVTYGPVAGAKHYCCRIVAVGGAK